PVRKGRSFPADRGASSSPPSWFGCPGTIGRWPGRGMRTCGASGRSWAMAKPMLESMIAAEPSKMGMATLSFTRCSLADRVVDRHVLAAARQVDGDPVGVLKACIRLERAVRGGHVVAVDGAQHVAVLDAQTAEQAAAADAVELHAHDASTLFVRDHARAAHQRGLVREQARDEAAVDAVLALADL